MEHHMHGTLIGHIAPGLYFIGFALFWTLRYSASYFQNRSMTLNTWTAVHSSLRPKCLIFESLIKVVLLSVTLVGEAISMRRNIANYLDGKQGDPINFGAFNAQHIGMYSGFLYASLVELFIVLVDKNRSDLGRTICYFLYIMAFFNEAFLFACHLHGRNELDRFVHMVVVIVALMCGFAGIWELKSRDNLAALLFRSFCVLLQGTWFCYIGLLIHNANNSRNEKITQNEMAAKIMNAAVQVTWHCVRDATLIGICVLMTSGRWFKTDPQVGEFCLLSEEHHIEVGPIQPEALNESAV